MTNPKPDKSIFIFAGIVTLLLFTSLYSINLYLNNEREDFLDSKMKDFLEQYEELQTLSLMSDSFGEEMTCLAMQSRKRDLDKTLWDAGIKIDEYRALSEEYMQSDYYIEQKINFNRNEVVYLSMLKGMEKKCRMNETILLYFYKKKEECADCDAQAFVLTDMKKELGDNISIFSFDMNLDIQPVNLLSLYYNISDYPCIVVEENATCGLLDKAQVIDRICPVQNYSICN